MRVGIGYDAHRLAIGRKLVLGGVTIAYERGLLGHSDADVLVHAVMDALLGAAGLGDIGVMFPDTNPAYKGVSSILLLREVSEALRKEGWAVVNVDSVIIAERPKLAPYIPDMVKGIAEALGVPPGCVNVKATTEERMGFTGSGEGMSAQAVALIERFL